VYLGGFDNVCHSLWRYRFPDAYGGELRPSDADIQHLGPAIDRYLAFLDAEIARLLASYPDEPNVIVLSDHGHEPILDHPLWYGWHGPRGMFLASGPSVRPVSEPQRVSYFDVVPTVADLLGFAVSPGMHGSSVLARAPASNAETPGR
jgi:predicted AlkP superfamily phosphohydrolase/phosphomutase